LGFDLPDDGVWCRRRRSLRPGMLSSPLGTSSAFAALEVRVAALQNCTHTDRTNPLLKELGHDTETAKNTPNERERRLFV